MEAGPLIMGIGAHGYRKYGKDNVPFGVSTWCWNYVTESR